MKLRNNTRTPVNVSIFFLNVRILSLILYVMSTYFRKNLGRHDADSCGSPGVYLQLATWLTGCNNDLVVARFGFNIILPGCACRRWGGRGQGVGGHHPGVGMLEVPVAVRVGG